MTSRTRLNREADVMHRFWDGGARKHPYFCVASGPKYLGGDIDLEAYFDSGEQAVRRIIALAGWHPGPGSRLIEIGCGTGRETRALAARFGFVDAIDISEAMISRAQNDLGHVGNIRLHLGNGIDLSGFAPCSFEYAFSELVFQHIPDKRIIENYLSETARVLIPGGNFAYQYNGRHRISIQRLVSGTRYWLRALAASARRRLSGKVVDPGYTVSAAWRGSKLSVKEIQKACAKYGLVIDQVLGQGTIEMWVIGHKPAEQKGA